MRKLLLIPILIALAGAAQAQPAPGGPDGPGPGGPPHGAPPSPPPPGGPGGPGAAPSPEALALIPGLSAEQQVEVRKILIARRNAHDALRDKERAEHERIDDDNAARLRKLLGEDGYRTLAATMTPPRPGRDGPPPAPDDGHGAGRGDRMRAPAPPAPPAPPSAPPVAK